MKHTPLSNERVWIRQPPGPWQAPPGLSEAAARPPAVATQHGKVLCYLIAYSQYETNMSAQPSNADVGVVENLKDIGQVQGQDSVWFEVGRAHGNLPDLGKPHQVCHRLPHGFLQWIHDTEGGGQDKG